MDENRGEKRKQCFYFSREFQSFENNAKKVRPENMKSYIKSQIDEFDMGSDWRFHSMFPTYESNDGLFINNGIKVCFDHVDPEDGNYYQLWLWFRDYRNGYSPCDVCWKRSEKLERLCCMMSTTLELCNGGKCPFLQPAKWLNEHGEKMPE
jgi:hypothetical protein